MGREMLWQRSEHAHHLGTSLHTLVQMVANGLGITLLPDLAVKANILGSANLKTKRFQSEKVSRMVGLAWRQSDPREQDYKALAAFIREWVTDNFNLKVIY